MSTYGTTRHHHSPAANYSNRDRVTNYHTTLFRRLTWDGTVPLEIRVDPKELPANSDRNLECYFVQAPRVSYLPLLMPEIRRFFMDLVFDETAAKDLKDEEWWFETTEGTLIKWHWPIGLIYDNHTISASLKPSTSRSSANVTPLRLILHLASPPNDKLLLSPSPEACKQAFMGQLKEADFIRWGSTKRMTGLRQQDQDGLWEGIKEHNFDDYWRVASKVTPTTAPTRAQSPAPPSSSASMVNRPPSADPGGPSERDGAYNVRSIPVRLYLPDGPVIQDLVPPMVDDNTPRTLSHYLTDHIPLLFPAAPPAPPPSRTNPHPRPPPVHRPAYALVQGIVMPSETEMAWLGGCLAGADGWVNVCIGINP
ncbi:autophagy protein Apg5-domain-containing protein [Lentinula edodes]|uniref:Autophagy protein Apg5-domain-containing protein n=1 Tax=Lentinula aff. lateritia TaxID=2804960 RepID=A0ACC1TQM1_9AGAR|nr:autophagy protein Apg5-domain-containing protein [Lentinula aff. lateritia]KAJ3906950.1 autophagy protein Apg5-domain-containing protein [Lentinula edodes]